MEIKLGSQVKDLVSGFTGIATARVEYLNGCVQYCIVPQSIDNKFADSHYFDHAQLIEIKGGISIPRSDTGGPSIYCPSH